MSLLSSRASLVLGVVALLAVATGCPAPDKSCQSVSCGPNGRCVTGGNGQPSCSCDEGYVAEGLTCVDKDSNPCDPNPCTTAGRTVCVASAGKARCDCVADRHEEAGQCVPNNPCMPNPCNRVNQNVCTAQGIQAVCSCNAGYAPEGAACSAMPVFDCAAKHSGGAADDTFEPDECPSLAGEVQSDGMELTGHQISPANDADWFRIAALEGRIYEVVATSPGGLRLYVDVYALDGVSSVAFDHRGGGDIFLRFKAAKSGAYYLRVRAFQANATGDYVLKISDRGLDDFADAPATASDSAVGQSIEGEIQYGDDADVIRVPLAGSHNYEVGASWTQGSYLVAELLGTDGKTVLQKQQGPAPKLSLRTAAAGSYFVRFTSALPTVLGKYTFTVKDNGLDDHGDVPFDATALTASDAFTNGSFERAGDADVFSFSASTGRIYRFTCNPTPSTNSCNAVLSDEAGNVLAQDTNGYSALLTYEAAKTGTLYLRLTSTVTGVHAYAYKLEDLGPDDHGDTPATATAITPGAPTANGRIELSGDLDYFSFTAVAGKLYRFTCTPSTELYSCPLRLFGPTGAVITTATNTFTFEAAAAGTHHIELKAYSTSYIGAYTYRLEDIGGDDHGDTPATATALTVGAAAATGSIELPGDLDYFSFTPTAGKIYRFTCTPSTQLYSCPVRVLLAAGTLVTSGTNTVTFEANAAGIHYIEAKGYSTSYTGSYTYSLESVGSDDHGDTAGTATALTPGAPAATGSIELAGDLDYFSFTATTGRIYRFTCTASASLGNCAVRLFGTAGQLLTSGTGSVIFEASATGTHAIEVKSYSTGYTGTYDFALVDLGPDDHADSMAGATSLTVGAPLATGFIELPADVDYFSFTATASRIYRFTCNPSAALVGCAVRVLNSTGTLLAAGSTSVAFEAPAAGLHYVEVKASSSSYSGSYTYVVEDIGADDHGDTITAATPISAFGTAATGTIELAADVDYFSFTAVAGKLYRFTCTPSTSLYQCPVRILSNAGTLLASGTNGTTFKAGAAATHYVEVRGYSTSYTGSYTYLLEDLGAEDHGDTMATATALTAGDPAKNGAIELAGDLDYFSFSATLNKIYRFTCTPSTSLYQCPVRILNPTGVQLITGANGASFKASQTGTHYIEAKGYSTSYTGTYTYRLEDLGVDDHGDAAVSATAIPLATVTNGNIELGGDVDWFSFPVTAGTAYQVTSTTPFGLYLYVYSTNGTTLVASTSSTTLSFTANATGNHYLRVAATSSASTGAYTVKVQ